MEQVRNFQFSRNLPIARRVLFLVRFFACVRRVESYRKTYGFKDEEEALTILIRLVKLDESVFKAYPEL